MLIKNCIFIKFFSLLICTLSQAQLPVTQLYHFKITKVGGEYSIKSGKYITAFNPRGYNNQPAFFNDDIVYFTTNYYDSIQTEIAKFDFFEKKLERITYTPESEYSPIAVPATVQFSCVRVESDGKTQTLSIYPLDGMGIAKRYMNNTRNIGYYNWLDDKSLALFLVEEPSPTLAIAEAISERRKIILDKVGRTLKVDVNGNLYFVHKIDHGPWQIKMLDRDANKLKIITETLEEVEDFELLVDGSILSGKGSKLYHTYPDTRTGWVEIADLSDYQINNISRIAVYKGRLILVDNK